MQSRDRLAAPRCDLFERLLEIAEGSIFQHLPENVTPAQVQAALASLWELRQELVAEAKANRFHFAAATGSRHRCADAAYQHAFSLDPTLRAMFGATVPGIKWDDVARKGQTVLLDFRREQDEEMRRFKMLWTFSYLYEWIKARGRDDEQPFGVIIDEFAHMTQQVTGGTNPLARELDEFINVYMRQHTIWLTAAHQELYQIDEQLRSTLLSLGTYILGGTSRKLANALFSRDPWWVKHYRNVWGRPFPWSPLQVIAVEPEFMPLAEQTELFAKRIMGLGRFQFLLRPAIAEGHIGSAVLPLTIRDLDRDRETGEYQFPEISLMRRLRAALAKRAGTPVHKLLAEQEKRIPPSLPETTRRLSQPRQPSRQTRQRIQPKPPTDGATVTLPTRRRHVLS